MVEQFGKCRTVMSKDTDIVPLEIANLAAFFVFSVGAQELVPITVLDKNMFLFPI
ncbi:hypothetical protein [Paenibacillus illinoisensis]|uniref:hypothetical protein n=1 Tax=Paenibacillus illinoisensis TaxID=59845 RepID=UPI00301E5F34